MSWPKQPGVHTNKTASKWKLECLCQCDSLSSPCRIRSQPKSPFREERAISCKCETGQSALHIPNTLQCEIEAPKRRAHAHSQSKVITASSSILFSHWRRICQSQRETSEPHAMRALMGWFIGSEQWLPIWLVISHIIGSCSTSLFWFFWGRWWETDS